jgi:hypothetical protein
VFWLKIIFLEVVSAVVLGVERFLPIFRISYVLETLDSCPLQTNTGGCEIALRAMQSEWEPFVLALVLMWGAFGDFYWKVGWVVKAAMRLDLGEEIDQTGDVGLLCSFAFVAIPAQ